MLKFKDSYIVFEEIPDRVSLAVNITNCQNNCIGCHSPELRLNNGEELTEGIIDKLIKENYGIDCFLFMGEGKDRGRLLELAKYIKAKKMNIWCYTGFTFESLMALAKDNPKIIEFLKTIDVLIDGPFVLEKKSYDCIFRGSTNQRIIDSKNSVKNKRVVLVDKYYNTNNKKKNTRDRIYV